MQPGGGGAEREGVRRSHDGGDRDDARAVKGRMCIFATNKISCRLQEWGQAKTVCMLAPPAFYCNQEEALYLGGRATKNDLPVCRRN